jgi:serine phosphatase RsbU (regulator of sigma subunit)
MTSNAGLQTAAAAVADDQVQVLLVEDDDGDALLVGELLRDVGGAVVMLTGEASEHLGEQAVRAGAQDYLVKGEVSRLEQGLLPQPLLTDPRVTVDARCLPGGKHHLLGGDFYDVVESSDGWVHALIGDVCGRGPAEAALGVCLRVAWRTMVLAGRPAEEILTTVNELLEHERQDDTMFATLCMLSVHPDRAAGWVRMAGHLPPLLLYTDGLIEGRIGQGSDRLGSEGLMDLIREAISGDSERPGKELLDEMTGRVRELNGGDLNDDLAVLILRFSSRVNHA